MNITRYNYEEYFLLYVDRELTNEGQQMVEAFVAANPDLKAELDALRQLMVQPDKTIVFRNKELMMKEAGAAPLIHAGNYEEYFILYADNELSNEEKDLVEKFVYHHPQYQAAFELLQQLKLEPDTSLVFADKALLYREEDDDKVVVFRWWRVAIAVMIILFLGAGGWYSFTDHTNDIKPPVAANHTPAQTRPAVQQPQHVTIVPPDNGSTAITSPSVTAPSVTVHKTATKQQKEAIVKIAAPIINNSEDKSNDLQPANVSHNNRDAQKPLIAANHITVSPAAAPLKAGSAEEAEVRPSKEERLSYAMNNAPENAIFVSTVNNKNKFRGLFRKVTRVFEKTTNIESNDKGIRIANFEIALK